MTSKYSNDKNKRIKAQISNSNITKITQIFQKCLHKKLLRISSNSQSFFLEASPANTAKVTNSHYWTILAQIDGFFF